LVAMGLVGCSLDKQTTPTLSGPSGFGLSVTMTASPDQLPRDGASQSVVTLTARDSQGKPLAGQQVSLELGGNSAIGASLSSSTVVTNSAGQASFAVIAPQAGTNGDVVIIATPVGNDANNETPRTFTIKAVPTNGTLPTPQFTVTPAAPEVGQITTFDASATTDEGAQCFDACTYFWDFGDGTTARGRVVTHAFSSAKTFGVALVVVDASGAAVTLRQSVSVTAPTPPTASITAVPSPASVNQNVTFVATAKAAQNHSIVSYDWDFGDGSSHSSTFSPTHAYSRTGTFAVVLTVKDDTGQTTTATLSLVVNSGVTASFFFSPTDPKVGDTVTFVGSGSSTNDGTQITDWEWDFGDGDTASGETTSHVFGAAHTYVVQLTVTDSTGRKGKSTQNVTVK
jgi:PKD repeat protein